MIPAAPWWVLYTWALVTCAVALFHLIMRER